MDRRRNPLKDPAPFRAWLEGKPANEFVGLPRQGTSCPLAMFVRETGNADFVNVPDCHAFVADNQYFRVPDWAAEFIQRVDRAPAAIRADQALVLLDAIETAAGGS